MGRRKRMRSEENPKTLIPKEEEEGDEIIGTKEEKGFFACYLLTSLSPRHKGHTYIGFTVNPRRRIRQHNGEIRSGATRTKKARPWEMVLCIHGFPTNVSALQFEWAWQHPMESLAVRRAAAIFKSFSGIANKIKLAYTMLTLPTWQSLNLTVNFFSTKYTKNSSGCPSLPNHMKVQVRPMDELPCYTGGESSFYDNEDDRDDEEEFHEEGSTDGFIEEGLTTLIANNFADDRDRIEMESHEQFEWIEENGMRQPWDSPISKEDFKHPSELIESPAKNLASFASSFITEEIDHDMGFIEEGIDLGQAIRNQTQTVVDDDKDQPVVATEKETDKGGIFRLTDVEDGSSFEVSQPIRERSPAKTDDAFSFNAHHEIEVIDVLTPSPDCRISLRSKRRRADIIDLTKSPVFVQL